VALNSANVMGWFMKVAIYKNLHNGLFSVQCREGKDYGRVLAHVPCIRLHNVRFVVRERGRQRVLAERRKNVHAFVVGYTDKLAGMVAHYPPVEPASVSYNPYKASTFVNATGAPISRADIIRADVSEGITAWGIE